MATNGVVRTGDVRMTLKRLFMLNGVIAIGGIIQLQEVTPLRLLPSEGDER
jgi:hypothetical protein